MTAIAVGILLGVLGYEVLGPAIRRWRGSVVQPSPYKVGTAVFLTFTSFGSDASIAPGLWATTLIYETARCWQVIAARRAEEPVTIRQERL